MFPRGAAEWAVIVSGFILVAGELAVFAERGRMEVIAVAVEAVFGEIFVVRNAEFFAEFAGFGPGFCFDFKQLDI